MKYGFIERQRSVWPARSLCRLLKVSHSGFYTWVGRTPSHRALANERLTGLIRQSFAQSDRTYGSPRVWRDLIDWGEAVGENRVARLMCRAQLQARHKRRRMPLDAGMRLEHCIARNVLERQFVADRPNRKWAADFTYVWTAQGWLYVAVVIAIADSSTCRQPAELLVPRFTHAGCEIDHRAQSNRSSISLCERPARHFKYGCKCIRNKPGS